MTTNCVLTDTNISTLLCLGAEGVTFGNDLFLGLFLMIVVGVAIFVFRIPSELTLGLGASLFYALYLITENSIFLLGIYLSLIAVGSLIAWRLIKYAKL